MKSYLSVGRCPQCPMITRLRGSSASSPDKLDCYFITPPEPILEEILPNWQECDEKPRNSREFALIHQSVPAGGDAAQTLSRSSSFVESRLRRCCHLAHLLPLARLDLFHVHLAPFAHLNDNGA